MVETAPASSFEVPEPKFLFQLLVIALNDPALLGQSHQIAQLGGSRQSGEPVLGRLRFTPRPFDDQPYLLGGELYAYSRGVPAEPAWRQNETAADGACPLAN